jgi:hypothetical protein
MSIVPIVVARVIQGNAAILVLALIAPATSVGLFQAASRVAQIPSFFASGFLIGWIPLNKSPIGVAGRSLRGPAEYSARVFTLLVLILVALTLAISLASGVAIRIAAPSFGAGADLIPIVALGMLAFEVFHAYYRASSFPGRRWWYTTLIFIWVFPYSAAITAGGALAPTYAVAAGQLVASGFVLACFVALDHRGSRPLPVPWLRLLSVTAIATACVAAARLGGASATARLALGVVGVASFPLILRATGLVSRAETATAVAIVRSLIRLRMSDRQLRERLGGLQPNERRALVSVGWHRDPADDAAAPLGASADVVSARVVRGLRSFIGSGANATPRDAAIGRYLMSTDGSIQRDMMAEGLARSGVSLVELHELDEGMLRFRRLRRRGLRLLGHEANDRSGLQGANPSVTATRS